MAAATSLRFARSARRFLWLHDCFWSSAAWRIDATRVANAVELSANPPRTAFYRVIPNPTRADNSDGFDAAGVNRRPDFAANEFWARDRSPLWLERVRRSGGCRTRRRLSYWSVWTLWHRHGCGFGGLCRCSDRIIGRKN